MIQPDAYVRRLTFKQREDHQGAKGTAIRNQFGSSPLRAHRWGGSISPNSASISRARSPVADLRKRIFIALSYRRMGKASSGREFFTAPDVLSPMEFLSFSTSLNVFPSLSFLFLFPSSSTYCISRDPTCILLPLRNDLDSTRVLVIRFARGSKDWHASENTWSVGLSSDNRTVARKGHGRLSRKGWRRD